MKTIHIVDTPERTCCGRAIVEVIVGGPIARATTNDRDCSRCEQIFRQTR